MSDTVIVEENESGISLGSFMLGLGAGLALGVVGTIIYAAYSDEQFNKVVRKTRLIGDKASDTAGVIKDRVVDTVGTVSDVAKKTVNRVRGRAEDQVDSLVSN